MAEERHGVSWMLEDYETLATSLRNGLDDAALARALGRSLPSVRQAARRLLPSEGGKRRSNLDSLREDLQAPDYDWPGHLHASYQAEGRPLWSKEIDTRLRRAWNTGAPTLPALSQDLQRTEEDLARRMVERGIAPDMGALVDRLGCTDPSPVADWARLAKHDHLMSTQTLVVLGQHGILHAECRNGAWDFRPTLADLEPRYPGARWVIITRPLGETEGREQYGQFYAPSAPTAPAPLPPPFPVPPREPSPQEPPPYDEEPPYDVDDPWAQPVEPPVDDPWLSPAP